LLRGGVTGFLIGLLRWRRRQRRSGCSRLGAEGREVEQPGADQGVVGADEPVTERGHPRDQVLVAPAVRGDERLVDGRVGLLVDGDHGEGAAAGLDGQRPSAGLVEPLEGRSPRDDDGHWVSLLRDAKSPVDSLFAKRIRKPPS